MILKINPYIAFIAAILYSVFLGYIFHSGIIAYGPLIILGALVLVNEFKSFNKLEFNNWLAIITWLPYVTWASMAYLNNPYEGKYLSTYFLSILILPLVTLSLFRLLKLERQEKLFSKLYKLLFSFLAFQLIICLGQVMTYTFGVGLPVSTLYAEYYMITGTFTNSNDLAAIVLISAFIVLGLEKFLFKTDKYLFWILVASLLIITGSRSAIVLTSILFITNKFNDLKKLPVYILVGTMFFLISSFSLNYFSDNNAVARFLVRFSSLVNIFQNGVESDHSMTIRLGSYFHFINNLPKLGLGTGEINNYLKYSMGANFGGVEILFKNPHSLIVELGYWLGWPGLIFFFTPLFFLLRYSRRKISLIFVFLIASMIPSSILGSMIFFLFLILSFFDYKNPQESGKIVSL